MADFKFIATDVRRASRWKAARHAVLYPIFGSDWGGDIPSAMSKLRRMWHARLLDLKKLGWQPPLAHDKAHQWMRNCPPFGIHTDDNALPCNRPLICPFCWARRYVVKGFMFLERTLFGGTHPNAEAEPGTYLVESHYTQILSCTDRTQWGPRFVTNSLFYSKHDEEKSGKKFRPVETSMNECRGDDIYRFRHGGKHGVGVVMFRFDPKSDHARFTRSTLVLTRQTPPDVPEQDLSNAEQHYWGRVVNNPIKKDLVVSCRRAFAYPRGMLCEDVEVVLAFLRAVLPNRRWYSQYGGTFKSVFENPGEQNGETQGLEPD